MAAIRGTWNWLKMAWEVQPVLFVSSVMAIVGMLYIFIIGCLLLVFISGPLFVLLGPGTKKGELERLNWPTHYRCKSVGTFLSR